MLCGVKFCGGCNPRYERGEALTQMKKRFQDRIEFTQAEEGISYDFLLVIGGCTNCCASYQQYDAKTYILMWDAQQLAETQEKIENILNNGRN